MMDEQDSNTAPDEQPAFEVTRRTVIETDCAVTRQAAVGTPDAGMTRKEIPRDQRRPIVTATIAAAAVAVAIGIAASRSMVAGPEAKPALTSRNHLPSISAP
jgi:hypothetical protein